MKIFHIKRYILLRSIHEKSPRKYISHMNSPLCLHLHCNLCFGFSSFGQEGFTYYAEYEYISTKICIIIVNEIYELSWGKQVIYNELNNHESPICPYSNLILLLWVQLGSTGMSHLLSIFQVPYDICLQATTIL